MAPVTRVLTGTWQHPDLTPATGRVHIKPNVALTSPSDDVQITTPLAIELDDTGSIDVVLTCTDDPDISPSGWAYEIRERIAGAPQRTYLVHVPSGVGSVDLADLTPLAEAPVLVDYVLTQQVGQSGGPAGPLDEDGLIPSDQIAGGGGEGAVASVNGQTGVVVLTASDVDADAEGTATAALAAHTGALDPHPGYLTPAEGNAAYDALGAASSAVSAHAVASDPHGDRAAATAALSAHEADTTSVHGISNTAALETTTGSAAKVTTHAGAADPHADRAFTTAAIATHAGAVDPHGDRSFATSAVSTHAAASDPHGDRAYVDGKTVIGTVTGSDQPSVVTAQADITGMGLAITAGTWDFEYVVYYTASVNGASGIALDVTGPTNTLVAYTHLIQTGNATASEFAKTALSSAQSGAAITTAGTVYTARTRGRIVATGSGTLQLRFACRDGSTTTTVKVGSHCIARKVV